jgi:carbon storage regulator
MLVLSRKINETIVIGGNIRVTMTAIRNRQVRLAIDAPPEVRVMREELLTTPPDVGLERDRPCEVDARVRPDRGPRLGGVRRNR